MRAFHNWALVPQLAELLRFGMVGVLNTICTLSAIYALMAWGAGVYGANVIGYALGLAVSFVFNNRWTFPRDSATSPALVSRFASGVCVAYLANVTTVHACVSSQVNAHVAQLVGMPVYTIVYFLFCKFYIFSDVRDTRGGAT